MTSIDRSPAQIKLIVVLADLHAGSVVGLLPPGFVSDEGNEIKQNALQRWLWTCWDDANQYVRDVAGEDPFSLVVNGDALEGVHHGGHQLVSNDVNDHFRIAQQVLEPIAQRAAKVFFVKGTECHTGNRETNLARALGAEVNPDSGNDLPSFDRLMLEVNGIRCVFKHHSNCTTRPYLESGQMGPMLASEVLEAVRNGEIPPRVLCVAHRHRGGAFTNFRESLVVSPPWQALTRHGHKVVGSARTQPGIYILDFRGKQPGDLPEIRHRVYESPHQTAIKL